MSDDLDHLITEIDAIFDRRGLTADECETVFRTITALADLRLQETSSQPDMSKLARDLMDPRNWARLAMDDPKMLRLLEARDFAEGSMGAWLKKAIEEERTRQHAGNVVDIESKRRPPHTK